MLLQHFDRTIILCSLLKLQYKTLSYLISYINLVLRQYVMLQQHQIVRLKHVGAF